MPVALSNADKVLKTYYLNAVSDQLKLSSNLFYAKLRQTTTNIYGKDVKKTVRIGINGGVGAGTEDGTLPTAQYNQYEQFSLPLKNLYGVLEITDKAIRASASNEGAFINLLDESMEQVVKSAAFNFSRMLFGDGSGLLGTIESGTMPTYKVTNVQNFETGMYVDVYTPSSSVHARGIKIGDVDYVNSTIHLESSISAPEGYKLYLRGSKDLELTGLGLIFSEKPIYGVYRTKGSPLVPYMTTCEELTENEIQKAIDSVEMTTGSKIDLIICSWGVRRKLYDILSKYRYTDSVVLDGGVRAITFNGIPVVADRFCPKGTMYLINTNDFALHQLCDWQWLESEDGSILKQVPTKPVFTATLVKYADLMCYNPGGQAMISGITED